MLAWGGPPDVLPPPECNGTVTKKWPTEWLTNPRFAPERRKWRHLSESSGAATFCMEPRIGLEPMTCCLQDS